MPPSLPFTFLVHDPGTPPRKLQLEGSKIRVGRIHTSQLRLLDTAVAFSHASIEVGDDGAVTIRDIHSPGGTFVNEQRVTRQVLKSGDTIRVGDTRIEIAFGADAARLAEVEALGVIPPPPPPEPDAPPPIPEGPLEPREELARILERMGTQLAAAPPPHDPAEPQNVGEHLVAAWARIALLLDGFAGTELSELTVAVDQSLLDWPDAARRAPVEWWRRAAAGEPEPRWRLVRRLDLSETALGVVELGEIAAAPALRPLTQLALNLCGIDDEGAAVLASSPHMINLQRLELEGNRLGPAAALAFADSDALPALVGLAVGGNPLAPGVLPAQAVAGRLAIRARRRRDPAASGVFSALGQSALDVNLLPELAALAVAGAGAGRASAHARYHVRRRLPAATLAALEAKAGRPLAELPAWLDEVGVIPLVRHLYRELPGPDLIPAHIVYQLAHILADAGRGSGAGHPVAALGWLEIRSRPPT